MKKLVTIGLLSALPFAAIAGNWSLGGGALISANPYRSMKTNILPIPFISYQGKYLSIYGPFAKLRYPIDRNNIAGMFFQLGMQEFDPSETSLNGMSQLDKRERLFIIGPYYRYRADFGQFTGSVGYDISKRSNGGASANLAYAYPFNSQNRKFFIRPGVGVSWYNNKYAQHYYQISQTESTRSGLSRYQTSSFFQPFASLFAGISLGKKFFWTNVARLNYLPSKVNNSPMVNGKKFTYSLITGITYEIGDEKQRFNH